MAFGKRERSQRFVCRVLAPKRLETLIVERLHAERQPVDAGRTVAGEVLGLDAGRIGFQRDLGIALQMPMARDGLENCCNGLRRHQGWGAAAEEDAADASPRRERSEMRKLLQISGEEPRLVDAAMADMAVEVAIRALGPAERPMHVDTERFVTRHGHRPTISFSKARMRCDMAFFFAGCISPKVSL